MADHWYTLDGRPRHYRDNGKPTTLRDARKETLVPSVTGVLSVKAKPGLENWKLREAIIAAGGGIDGGESEWEFIKRVQAKSKERLEKASSEGDAIHKAIESAYLGEPYDERHRDNVLATQAEVARLFPDIDDWVPERTFAHPLGFGGTVDLHSPATGIVVDFKSKDGDLSKRLAYDQYIQIAAYRSGLVLPPTAYAANIFISRDCLGVVTSHTWNPEDLRKGWLEFTHCLALWKLEKNYDPVIAVEALAA